MGNKPCQVGLPIKNGVYLGSVKTNINFNQNKPAQFETATDGYWLMDAGVGTDIMVGNQLLSLSISTNTLFNTVYQDHLSTLKPLGIYDMGRNVAISLKIPIGVKN